MAYASSASRTCSAVRSHSEYTATGDTPISRHARITRTAISPRFAIRTLRSNLSDPFKHPRVLLTRRTLECSVRLVRLDRAPSARSTLGRAQYNWRVNKVLPSADAAV